ncbi:diacylglycerol kinase family protein [Nocardioides sp.]|uniref:diacylglycerol/lipid kinase family protein n=1 Tax=Nocardioides sp. TaxID=35761 RepID=UPI00260433CA|nr:YegS/Rv2252/BmrU family lipid kinase [Nocardioides sp.]
MTRVALLTNPTSGKGRGARGRAAALDVLRGTDLEVLDLVGRDGAEAAALVQDAAPGVDALLVCGGDGLVHLAVQALAGTGTALGVVPAGTGNDVARYLDLPRRDPAEATYLALEALRSGRRRTIDLARSGDRWFVTVLAAGFDAVVNERANAMTRPRGQMRYNIATVAALRTFTPITYTLDLDGEQVTLEAMMVAVGNGPSYGGGLRMTEGAVLDDGLLDVVVIGPMSKLELVRTYPRLFTGTHTTHPAYQHHRVRQVSIAAPGITTYADGERFGALPLTVECVPGALQVLARPPTTAP